MLVMTDGREGTNERPIVYLYIRGSQAAARLQDWDPRHANARARAHAHAAWMTGARGEAVAPRAPLFLLLFLAPCMHRTKESAHKFKRRNRTTPPPTSMHLVTRRTPPRRRGRGGGVVWCTAPTAPREHASSGAETTGGGAGIVPCVGPGVSELSIFFLRAAPTTTGGDAGWRRQGTHAHARTGARTPSRTTRPPPPRETQDGTAAPHLEKSSPPPARGI
jgi:hypothetical protein